MKLQSFPLVLKLFTKLADYLPMIIVSAQSDVKLDDKKLQESEDIFLKFVMEKIKYLWLCMKQFTWRDRCTILRIIPTFQRFFPIQDYNEYFLGEILNIINTSNFKVKEAAAQSMCDLLSCNYHSAVKKVYFSKIISMANADSYYERSCYLIVFKAALQYFSLSLIASQGLFPLFLNLANDKTSNMKIRFLEVIHEIICHITKDYQNMVIEKIKELQNDKNKDVKEVADKIFKKIQTILESNTDIQEQIKADESMKLDHENKITYLVIYRIKYNRNQKKGKFIVY